MLVKSLCKEQKKKNNIIDIVLRRIIIKMYNMRSAHYCQIRSHEQTKVQLHSGIVFCNNKFRVILVKYVPR